MKEICIPENDRICIIEVWVESTLVLYLDFLWRRFFGSHNVIESLERYGVSLDGHQGDEEIPDNVVE